MKVYEKIYNFYVNEIEQGLLKAGEKMPSIRESEKTLNYSRTSIETAYMQLAADGYIYSVEKIGYFVTETADIFIKSDTVRDSEHYAESHSAYKYDLSTLGEDKEVSCLDLWRRYMKSALRQEDRLLMYASSQGELDLRREIVAYVRKNRNIICNPEDVVIGAGFQNLLQVLIALIPGERSISFPTKNFADGAMSFYNAGFEVSYRNKESHVIYVTPSYMTKWGEVMTMKRRHELIEHSLKNDHLIIEDDYQNEFVFSSKPTPSLYAMTGGENVAFLGSFSRILLPSVRISYLILPRGVRKSYEEIKDKYNQTASMAEQIALAQFLRDGHLSRHIKKMRRLYQDKKDVMLRELESCYKNEAEIFTGESGMEIGLKIRRGDIDVDKAPVKVTVIDQDEGETTLLLSCSIINISDIPGAILELKNAFN